jgi:hypothetical protein
VLADSSLLLNIALLHLLGDELVVLLPCLGPEAYSLRLVWPSVPILP